MKSAYELAMERLQKEDPDSVPTLTHEQKEELQRLEESYKAKTAEREVFLQKQLTEARSKGDPEAVAQIEKQMRNERDRLEEEKEAAKEKVRQGKSAS
ncbi:MAG: hypothetical protein GVY10_08080 [Verrucomicrobia bacterium]|jgi:hypothetical protein|nr:hypothetical protein [Verrucomicrobiota bacterium]